MRKFFLSCILASVACLTQAQAIKGYVYSADNNPVEFANVMLLSLPDSALVKGGITYTEGLYSFENIAPGKYYIKATYVGYREGGLEVLVQEGDQEIWIDNITISEETEELDEVVVIGNYIRAKELVDRTVYEILPEIEKTSTNGYDVLRKIPSVQVDFNNNVTLNGKTNFIIQVDGKQRDKEFLARIRPEDIESIEVISNPSGRYEGDIEGVINVVLKPEARIGISGLFGGQVKPFGKYTAAGMGSLDYGMEKITFYVSGYSFLQRLNISSTDYRRISIPFQETIADSILDMAGTGDFSISASAINAGIDYYLNKNNTLSLNYSYKPFSNLVYIYNDGDISMDGQDVNRQEHESNVSTGSSESNASLFYRKKFRKPIKEFTIESNYYSFNSKDNNDFTQLLFATGSQDFQDSSYREELTINSRNYFSTKVDYIQPLGVSVRLEAGYQFYIQNMDYQYETTDLSGNNNYLYSELRNAAYTSLYWKLKKFSLQATLRIENSNITINEDIQTDYLTLLPSSNIMYKFNPKHSLKFTYNRRINRPNIYRLNPFERLNNDMSVSTGNPYLEPELRDRLQLSYTMNIKKVNFSPYIYHEFYSDKIDNRLRFDIASTTGQFTVINSPDNLLTGYEQGFGLNTSIAVFNLNGSIFRGHFNAFSDSLSTIDARDYYSYRLTSFVAVPVIKEKLTLFALVNYTGAMRTAQSLTYSPLIYGLGGQYNLKNHSFGMFYLLPLSKRIQFSKVITETPVIYSENIQYFDASWFIQFTYSYKFNRGRAIKKSGHEVDVESDTKGGGLGQ